MMLMMIQVTYAVQSLQRHQIVSDLVSFNQKPLQPIYLYLYLYPETLPLPFRDRAGERMICDHQASANR